MLKVCGQHAVPLMYSEEECPMCDFLQSLKRELEEEYKRGYNDGLLAKEGEENEQRGDVDEG